MDSIFSNINIEINRPTIKSLYVYDNKISRELLEINDVLADKDRFDNLKRRLEFPFSDECKDDFKLYMHHIRLNVEYVSQDESIREKTLFFEFNNYILEFAIPKVSDYTNVYYLKHIHKIDSNLMTKRKILGVENIILTAEQIDKLLNQGKIHQII